MIKLDFIKHVSKKEWIHFLDCCTESSKEEIFISITGIFHDRAKEACNLLTDMSHPELDHIVNAGMLKTIEEDIERFYDYVLLDSRLEAYQYAGGVGRELVAYISTLHNEVQKIATGEIELADLAASLESLAHDLGDVMIKIELMTD